MIKQNYRLVIWFHGPRYYYYKNKHHRLNGPSIIRPDSHQCYYANDERHRLDGPSIIWRNGNECYYVNNKWKSKEDFYQKYYQKKND